MNAIQAIHELEMYIAIFYAKLGMQASLAERWQQINYTPPKGGWQRRLF